MFKNRTAIAIAIAAVFFSVIVTLHVQGIRGRSFAEGVSPAMIDSTEEAYALWTEKKVLGRTLLLFGSYPHIKRSSDYAGIRELTPSNFIEFAAFNNIIRRIYFIIPDDAWERVVQQRAIGVIRKAAGMERGLYLFTFIGIPVIATTPSSLPRLTETALVYVNNRHFDPAFVQDVLLAKGITSDIFLTYHEN